ncbi:hypothetical protein CSB45_02665 [candidate division KSB3 bacterium]|uniref:Uncharacterized protein n=1 Tax=candidate division KSB3 bacterium TaxID=2044937 RepID=A0A2G6EAW9_9BACT|nr:MAG: hypothetical protein CSB45_02665 [candidate division KSB3 bacterium]PIE30982.1 MAG: hypothetical protein CSA57_01280 [candidate division KSB3 bacterium]
MKQVQVTLLHSRHVQQLFQREYLLVSRNILRSFTKDDLSFPSVAKLWSLVRETHSDYFSNMATVRLGCSCKNLTGQPV